MNQTKFYIQFGLFILVVALLIFGGLHRIEQFVSDQKLSIFGILFFSLYTIGLYYLSIYSIKSPNKGLFTSIHLGTIFLKMLLTVALIFVYREFYLPESRLYIIPYIVIYVLFTIYETYMMMKISKSAN